MPGGVNDGIDGSLISKSLSAPNKILEPMSV